MNPFRLHCLRVEAENTSEKFSLAPPGTFRQLYTATALRKRVGEPGWLRLWCVRVAGTPIAHASLYCLGQGEDMAEGVCYGHISVEKPWRGKGLYDKLQAKRFAFLDTYGLTLAGAVALGNDTAFHTHRKAGYQFLRHDTETKATWIFREPKTSTVLR